MTRARAVLLLVLVLAASVAGVVVASGGPPDPAPPRAGIDVPGVVSIGRPVERPPVAGAPPTGTIELRATDPDGGPTVAVLQFPWSKVRRGTLVRYACHAQGPEARLRRYPTAEGGPCRPLGARGDGPWSVSVGSGTKAGVAIGGTVRPQVRRLTVAGPGGTFVVPRSRTGAFLVLYGEAARGSAVLTARLADGSTRYYRTSLPPTLRPDGVALASDPEGLPMWWAQGGPRPTARRTCVQVNQDAGRDPRRDSTSLRPVCGDLTRGAVFARTIAVEPRSRPGTFGPGPSAPRRTVLVGAIASRVREVAVVTVAGRRVLPVGAAGRTFLAVFPPSVRSFDLLLEVTLRDGRVQRFPNPRAVNRAVARHPIPRILGAVRLRRDPVGGRRVVLTARLDRPARRFEVTFLGREVRMRPVAGSPSRYRGVYDGDRGVRRPIVSGRVYGFSTLTCGDHCDVRPASARLP